MAFPGTSLDLLVEAYFGQWVDLSERLTDRPVNIPQRGAPNGSRSTAAGSCNVTLDDDDGALTPLNPSSNYYPYVRRGTPFRVSVRRLNDSFSDRTTSAGWGTGWTTITAGGTVSGSDTSVAGGLGRHSVPAALAYRANYNNTISLSDTEVRAVFDLPDTTITGGPVEPANVILRLEDINTYYLVRVSIDASEVVTIALHHTVAGELASAVSTGITYSGQQLAVAGIMVGPWFAAKIWDVTDPEPRDWQIETQDHTYTGRGYCGVRSGVGPSNSDAKPVVFEYSSVEIRSPRAAGSAAAYRSTIVPRTDRTMVSAQTIEIGGLLRQLERGKSTEKSALTRYLPDTDPVAWWPMEDGVDSTQAASGLPDGRPLAVIAGVMDFVDDGPPGTAGAAHPSKDAANALNGAVRGVSSTAWQVAIWTRATLTASDVGYAYYIPWEIRTTSGKILRLIHQYKVDVAIGVGLYDSEDQEDETDLVSVNDPVPRSNPGITGEWMLVQFTVMQSGADTNAWLDINGETLAGVVWSNCMIGAPRRVDAIGAFVGDVSTGVSHNVADIYLSHLAFHDGVPLAPLYEAGLGFPGELAVDRIARVSDEEGVPIHITSGPDDSAAMGPQPTAALTDVLRDCEYADFGILGESRGALALTYRTGSARQNLPVALTVDLSTYDTTKGTSASVLNPVYDDQGLRNEITAERVDGSSAVAIDQSSVDADGRYDESVEVNVATDDQLPNVAYWLLREGTVDEYRNPQLPIDLAANPDLIDAWLSTDVASRVQRTNPPAPHPPGTIDQVITGYSETFGHRSWTVGANCQPASPWDVATADGDQRVPADGSTLIAGITDSATSLLLGSTIENGPWWVGDTVSQPDDFPLDVRVGGEVVTVSEIEPSVTDVFGRTVSNGWGSADTGQAWTTSGGATSDYSVSGGTGRHSNTDVNNQRRVKLDIGHTDWDYTVDVLLPMTNANTAPVTVWVAGRLTDDSNHYLAVLSLSTGGIMSLRLDKRVGGALTNVTPAVTVASNTSGDRWRVRFRGSGTTLWATAENVTAGTDPVSVSGTDTSLTAGTQIGILTRLESGNTNTLPVLIQFDNLTVNSPQLVTLSARGVNGISRAWPVGTAVDVAAPAIAAL